MFKKLLFLILVFTQCFTFNAFAQESPNAAVMKFSRSKNIGSEFSETISSIVRNEAQQMELYDVVNKFPLEFEDILLVLDCKIESSDCLSKVAAQLKASVLIFGSINDKGERIQIILNVFDVKKKKIDKRLIRYFERKKDPVVAFRKELQYFFGTKKPDEPSIVKIDANIPKAKIFLNNKFAGLAPLSKINMKPGAYQIRVEAPGYTNWETRINVTEKSGDLPVFAQLQKGGAVSKIVKKPIEPLKKVDTTFVPDPIEESSSLNWGAIATTGVGLVTMATSSVFYLQFKETEEIIEDRRSRGTLRPSGYNDLVEKGNTQETIHFILLGTGAAITTFGVVWFAITPAFSEQAIQFKVSPQQVSASFSF